MRRNALLGLACLLGGCQFVGSPFDGFGGFLYDTQTFHSNPNLPPGGDETMRRVENKDVSVEPLLPEPGDVWPGPMQPIPTMQDLQQQNNMERLPPPNVPAAPPPPLFPETTPVPHTSAAPATPPKMAAQPAGGAAAASPGGDVAGVRSIAGQGILVPNGNGTSTLISPDGTMKTVPTPQ